MHPRRPPRASLLPSTTINHVTATTVYRHYQQQQQQQQQAAQLHSTRLFGLIVLALLLSFVCQTCSFTHSRRCRARPEVLRELGSILIR
ncbi:hypothetical protein HN011_011702 [Eciton burchellii]|nr:hypothetical protein HN011_011702 [Eciton burchellii]